MLAGFSLGCDVAEAIHYSRGTPWRVGTCSTISVGTSGGEEGDTVPESIPVFPLCVSGRLNLRLDYYTAQGLFYTDHRDADQINNNLLLHGTAKLYQNNLFLDAYGSVYQSSCCFQWTESMSVV